MAVLPMDYFLQVPLHFTSNFALPFLWPASRASRAKNNKWTMVIRRGLHLGLCRLAL